MYNYIALWIRLIWPLIICLISGIVLFVARNKFNNTTKIVFSLLITGLLILNIIDAIPSIINPKIKCIVGVYNGESRITGTSPFLYEYCFENDNGKYYIDLDVFSKKSVYPKELIVGDKYQVHYETTQNLIVRIKKTHENGSPIS